MTNDAEQSRYQAPSFTHHPNQNHVTNRPMQQNFGNTNNYGVINNYYVNAQFCVQTRPAIQRSVADTTSVPSRSSTRLHRPAQCNGVQTGQQPMASAGPQPLSYGPQYRVDQSGNAKHQSGGYGPMRVTQNAYR